MAEAKGYLESRGDPRVTPGEIARFCGAGRLVGTPGNREAGTFLKELLEREGYTAMEAPPPALSVGRFLIPIIFSLALVAVFRRPNQLIFLLPLAMNIFRLWQGVRAGAPAALYGIRQGKGVNYSAGAQESAGSRPTLILCAHYDSASLPFLLQGSFVGVNLKVLGVLLLVGLLGVVTHPLLSLIGTGMVAVLFCPRNDSPGADDNASGVFAVFECLRRFGHREGVNVVPVFFNYEELGLWGSRVWVRRHLGRKGQGLPKLYVDRENTYVINFDCVGRGRRIFISGNRNLRERLLGTASAKALGARRAWLYPSDHWAFRPRWRAVAFAWADRLWFLDLHWVHSKKDVPWEIRLQNLADTARIVEEFLQEISLAGSSASPFPA